jgi:TolA-binding protein
MPLFSRKEERSRKMIRTLTVLAVALLGSLSNRISVADDAEDLFALAAGYYNQQRWEAAADKMSELLQAYPDHSRASEAAFYRGEALMQTGDYPGAIEQFNEMLERWPNHVRRAHVIFRVGESAYLTGDHENSERSLRNFVKSYPEDALAEFAYPYLGEIAVAAKRWEQAQSDFELALQKWPTGEMGERCRFGLGRAFDGQGNWQEAQRFYRYVGYQGQSDLVDEALLNLAIIHFQAEQNEEVEKALSRLMQTAPESPLRARGWYLLGRIHQRKGDVEKAGQAYADGIAAADPQDSEITPALLYEYALTLETLHRSDEAHQHWAMLVERFPNSEFSRNAYQKQMETAYAAEQWDRVLELAAAAGGNPAGPELVRFTQEYRGRALLAKGDFKEAASVFEQLIADQEIQHLREDEIVFAYLWGLSLVRNGDFEDALPILEETRTALDQGPLAPGVLLALETAQAGAGRDQALVATASAYLEAYPDGLEVSRVRVDRCLALVRLQQWSQADEALTDFVEHHPEHESVVPTLQRMADLAYQAQQYKLASKWFGQLAGFDELGDEEAVVFLAIAWSRARDGDFDEAQRWFQRLVDEHPDHPLTAQAALERGRYFENQDAETEALQQYQFVIDRFPETGEAYRATLAAGLMLMRLGDQEHLQQAAQLFAALVNQQQPEAQADLACYQLAWIQRDLGDASASQGWFEQVVKNHPQSKYRPDSLYRLAERAAQLQDYASALRWIGILREEHPDVALHEHATYLAAQVASRQQDWETVISETERLQMSQPDSRLLPVLRFWKAESLYRLQRSTEADALFGALVAEQYETPQNWRPIAILRRAQLAAIAENWEGTRELCEQLRQQYQDFKQDYEVDYLLGRYHSSKGDFIQSREAYQRVIRSPRGSQTETAAMAQWMIGETYFHQDEYRHAIEAYHRVETLYNFPQWKAAALLQSGKCHERMNQPKHAVTLYAQLLKELPDSEYADEASRRMSVARQRVEP